jgi:Spy/CpxP family protein refolding chaperone
MLKTLISIILLTVSSALYAQATPGTDTGKAPREGRFDCSKAKDPKACEERVAKAKAARDKARQACEGKTGDEQRDCMRREMCAQTKDPAKCEAQVKERMAQRAKIREACKDKKAEELKACIREQRQKK